MSRIDVVPEVLWQPGPDRIARARITDFAEFVAARTGLDLPDYRVAVGVLDHGRGAASGPRSRTTSACGGIGRRSGCWPRR